MELATKIQNWFIKNEPSEDMLYKIYKIVSKVSGRKINMPVFSECADVFKIKISDKMFIL